MSTNKEKEVKELKKKVKESLQNYQEDVKNQMKENKDPVASNTLKDVVERTVALHEKIALGFEIGYKLHDGTKDIRGNFLMDNNVSNDLIKALDLLSKLNKEARAIRVAGYNRKDKHSYSTMEYLKMLEDLVGYNDGYRSLEVLTTYIYPFTDLEYKLTDIKDDGIKNLCVEVIKRVIESNEDSVYSIMLNFLGDRSRASNEGQQKEINENIVCRVLNRKPINTLLVEKLTILLNKSRDMEEQAKKEEEKTKESVEQMVYKVLDSPLDTVAQDRMVRLKAILSDTETNNFKGIKTRVIAIKDKQGLQMAIKGLGFYISTKGVYIYNGNKNNIETLLKYNQEDEGGLLDWWFGQNGTYSQLLNVIGKLQKDTLSKEDKVDLQKLGDILVLAYNRRKRLDEKTIDSLNEKYKNK